MLLLTPDIPTYTCPSDDEGEDEVGHEVGEEDSGEGVLRPRRQPVGRIGGNRTTNREGRKQVSLTQNPTI